MTNDHEASDWNGELGDRWVRNQERLDAWLAPIGDALLDSLEPLRGLRVLDVGCGCGASTIEIARRGGGADVLGIDLSEAMIARARSRAAAAGIDVRFVAGDVTTAELGEHRFDLLHSRFGVMFFQEPAAGFARLRELLSPTARIGFACWQSVELNTWASSLAAAVATVLGPKPPEPPGPGPFSLADPDELRRLLAEAGFDEVSIEPLPMRLDAGPLDQALELFGRQVGGAARRIREAEPTLQSAALAALEDTLGGYEVDGSVLLPTATWLVQARARA